jgi:hypothetical protein
MNIFKTLASGSGSINEPNVSAFLGYLLNPKEDHGLGDAFLRRFLEPLLLKNDKLKFWKKRNLSIHSNFEFEVLLEQAFKNDDNDDSKKAENKQIVDIVVLCYEKSSYEGMFLAEEIIKQKKEGGRETLRHIFLIENKIKETSVRDGQLKEQFEQTIKKLEKLEIDTPKDLVSVIFVTPGGKDSIKEFDDLKETNNKIHLFWNSTSTTGNVSISKIIKDILGKESQPIDAYCKYTLKAFLEFIENGFKSTITEELEKKREYTSFKYDGKPYSRPKLAEKIISDYISNYAKENNKEITFDELRNRLFPEKKDWNIRNSPFVKKEDANCVDFRIKDGSKISDFYGYYNNPIPIADAEICCCTGWPDEKKLQELLDKTVKIKLDDIRIK